jgi:AcrR family transcriptional regulator
MARTAGSHKDITGPRLRNCATELFAKHGYAAVSMRQIASHVGVQVGALYNYIPDKQTLLFDLMRDHLELLLAERADDPDADPLARLDAFVRFHIRFHHDRRDAVFIAYMELRNLSDENFKAIEALRNTYEARLRRIVDTGVKAGKFSIADDTIATRAIIAMLTGLTTWYRPEGPLTLAEIEANYIKLVRGAVGCPG